MTQTHQARYEAWLGDRSADGEIVEGPRLGDSPYRLFFVRRGPGIKAHAAAVSDDAVVTAGDPAGWGAYLRSTAPAVLHHQIGWLNGAWASHAPSEPASKPLLERDPDAARLIGEPDLVVEGDRVTFTAWYGQPPRMDPFRLTVVVDGDQPATFSTMPLWKMK